MPTLYEVLALPSSATRDEIRAAYRTQLLRIRSGVLPPFLEDLVEVAYATLDYPDRRVEYDLSLAAARQQRHRFTSAWFAVVAMAQAAASRLRPSPRPLRLPTCQPLTSTAGIAVLCLLVLAVAYGLGRSTAGPTSTMARRTATAPTPRAQPPTSVASESPQTLPPSPELASEPPQNTPDVPEASGGAPTIIEPPPSAHAPPAPRVMAQPTRQVTDFSTNEAEAVPEPSTVPETPAAPAAAPSSPSLVMTQIVRSLPVTGEKVVTVIVGRYCQDASGGQVFTPVNAPAPSLTC